MVNPFVIYFTKVVYMYIRLVPQSISCAIKIINYVYFMSSLRKLIQFLTGKQLVL